MSRNALVRLHDLAVFVGAEEDLRTHLGLLVDLAASVTDAATCSIMLLSEGENDAPRLKLWGSSETLPASAWNETPGRGESIAGRVLEQSAPLLIADIRASEFAPLARGRENLGASFICTPISVGKHVIGVMNLSSRLGSPPFDESDLGLAEIVATLIGKSVQVERLQTLIRSRVAHLSLAREKTEFVARLTDGTVPPRASPSCWRNRSSGIWPPLASSRIKSSKPRPKSLRWSQTTSTGTRGARKGGPIEDRRDGASARSVWTRCAAS